MKTPDSDLYRSYLLRLWRGGSEPNDLWHASLEDVRTREQHHFASLEALSDFLQRQALPHSERGG